MDVIFGSKLEVPMYQNLKVKCEPVSKTNNQDTVVTVREINKNYFLLLFKLINFY